MLGQKEEVRQDKFHKKHHAQYTIGVKVEGAIAYGIKSPLAFNNDDMTARFYL